MGKIVAEQKVGFLHDVVEDSAITIDDLRAEGVEEDVLAAVDLLPIGSERPTKSMCGTSSSPATIRSSGQAERLAPQSPACILLKVPSSRPGITDTLQPPE